MEPVTTTVLGIALWEYLGEPIIDKAKDKYAEEILNRIDSVLSKFSFNSKEKEIIEVEIIESNVSEIENKEALINFMNKNENILNALNSLNQRETQINIKVDKGVGYINTMNGDISF